MPDNEFDLTDDEIEHADDEVPDAFAGVTYWFEEFDCPWCDSEEAVTDGRGKWCNECGRRLV